MKLELQNARVEHRAGKETDSGADAYWVIAFDNRFGDELLIAEFGYDNTHENGFYKIRAGFLANQVALTINQET